jgi:hypothetical protein
MRKRSSSKTSGLWPTPTANDDNKSVEAHLAMKQRMKGGPRTAITSLQCAVKADARGLYPTMTKSDGALEDFIALNSIPTSEPSTERATEAQPYLPEGFLASHFPRPGSEEARKMTVTSGRKCSGLYTKLGPLGCLVRTLLESSRWNSTECFLTWKVKATPSRRLLFQLAPSTPNTDETEFGLWRTLVEGDAKRGVHPNPKKQAGEYSLLNQVKLRPTPRAAITGDVTAERVGDKFNNLESVIAREMFMTPDYGAAKGRGIKSAGENSRLGGSLNPPWVEWLMGYPQGWTVLKDSAMRSFRKSRSKSSRASRKTQAKMRENCDELHG